MAEPKTKTYYALKVTRDNGSTYTQKPDSDGELFANTDTNGGYVRATRVPQDLANAKAAAAYQRTRYGVASVELVVRTRTTVDEPVVETPADPLPTEPGLYIASGHAARPHIARIWLRHDDGAWGEVTSPNSGRPSAEAERDARSFAERSGLVRLIAEPSA